MQQREIKFRAWDKKSRTMFPAFNLYSSVFFWEKIRPLYKDIYKMLIFMQYTGLKDKKGKEIYEGDIVKSYWYDINKKFIGGNWVVKYGGHSADGNDYYSSSAEGFYFERCDGKDREEYNIGNLPVDGHCSKTYSKHLEKIGSIYENPELLKNNAVL